MEGLRKALEKEGGFFFIFDTFAEMERSIEDMLGGASEILLSSIGKACGERSCRRMMEKEKTEEELLEGLRALKSAENWEEFSFLDVNLKDAAGKVLIKNSLETRVRGSLKERPSCHFMRGFLERFLSELFKRPISVVEKRCASMGGEYCEFSFGAE